MPPSPFVDVLTIRRSFNAPRSRVFNAWKDPEMLRKWLGGQSYQKLKVDVDFRVGGSYRLDIVAPDGNLFHLFGEYQEIVEPERLVFTWCFDHWEAAEDTTLVTITLDEVDGKTQVTLTHERFHDASQRDMHREGWEVRLERIEQLLEQTRP